jgi:succinate dehydrogenase / fumarate reductase iron-sulfur subunit
MSPRASRLEPPARAVRSAEAARPTEADSLAETVRSAEASSVEAVRSADAVSSVEAARATVRFRVSRRKTADRKRHFDIFDVEVAPEATLLDALLEIRRRHDRSLVVRHSCLHAACGTCGVRINGREALACDTKIADLPFGKPIRVEPLAGQRLVSDLATDMVDFYARFEAARMPLVRGAESPVGGTPPDGIRAFGRFENCIECGLCLSACPISRTNRSYIGPAALAAAARVVAEPRGLELGPVLALAAEPDSVWRCRDAMECTAVCPSSVDPALALLGLRRHVAARGVGRLFRRRT